MQRPYIDSKNGFRERRVLLKLGCWGSRSAGKLAALALGIGLAACDGSSVPRERRSMEPLPFTQAPHASVVAVSPESSLALADRLSSGEVLFLLRESAGSEVDGIVVQDVDRTHQSFLFAPDGLFSEIRLGGFVVRRTGAHLVAGKISFEVTSPEGEVRTYENVELPKAAAQLPALLRIPIEHEAWQSATWEFEGLIRDIPRTPACFDAIDFEEAPDASSLCLTSTLTEALWNAGARFSTAMIVLHDIAEYRSETRLADAVRRFTPMRFRIESRLLELSRQAKDASVSGADTIGLHYQRGTRFDDFKDTARPARATDRLRRLAADLRRIEGDPNAKTLEVLGLPTLLRPNRATYSPWFNGQHDEVTGLPACLSNDEPGCAAVLRVGGDVPSAVAGCPAGYTTRMWAFSKRRVLPLAATSPHTLPANDIDRLECWSGSNRATNRRTVIYFAPNSGYAIARVERWHGFVLDGVQEEYDNDEDGTHVRRRVSVQRGFLHGPYAMAAADHTRMEVEGFFVKDQLAGPYRLWWSDTSLRSLSLYQEIGGVTLNHARYALGTGRVCSGGFAPVNRSDPAYGSCAH